MTRNISDVAGNGASSFSGRARTALGVAADLHNNFAAFRSNAEGYFFGLAFVGKTLETGVFLDAAKMDFIRFTWPENFINRTHRNPPMLGGARESRHTIQIEGA